MIYKIIKWLYGMLDKESKTLLLAVVLDDIGNEAKVSTLSRLDKKDVLEIIDGVSDGIKLVIADKLLGDVLKSKTYSIDSAMAERISIKIAKSTGNKICDFMLKE